jgi:hypothetical protein
MKGAAISDVRSIGTWNSVLFDSKMSVDVSFSRCVGWVGEVLNGLVNVFNVVELPELSNSSSFEGSIRPWYISTFSLNGVDNDLSFFSSLFDTSLSSSISHTLVWNNFSKSLSADVTSVTYPTYWSDEALLNYSMMSLAFLVNRRVSAVMNLGYYGSSVWLPNVDNIMSVGSDEPILSLGSFLGVRGLSNLYGSTVRFLLKTWLRWGDDTLLSSLWYSQQVMDSAVSNILGVNLRVTGSIDYISKMSVSSPKMCYGAVVRVASDLVDITGLSYEVQSSSAATLLFVSAYWSHNTNQYTLWSM